ncbi:MAG: oligosaccharide flippase family protein, partial [Nitrososphaera sp.]|nr:oligosaccharide flippase family protein [Nitrososphaera sp.]
RFDYSNAVRIPLGVLMFVSPVLALQISDGLVLVVIALAISRLLGWWAFRALSLSIVGGQLEKHPIDLSLTRPLLSFGGWMTISNVVSPLLAYLDRFVVGSIISVSAVAYYATPYELVTKLWVIPAAFVAVLFPRIAELILQHSPLAERIYRQAMLDVFAVMLPLAGLISLFAAEGLTWWLGVDFSRESSFVAQCLVLAVFVNSLGQVAHSTLLSGGKAKWCAALHVAELPAYLILLVWFAKRHEINGVAIAWLIRIVFDTSAMLFLTQHLFLSTPRFSVGVMASSLFLIAAIGYCGLSQEIAFKFVVVCLLAALSFTILRSRRFLS